MIKWILIGGGALLILVLALSRRSSGQAGNVTVIQPEQGNADEVISNERIAKAQLAAEVFSQSLGYGLGNAQIAVTPVLASIEAQSKFALADVEAKLESQLAQKAFDISLQQLIFGRESEREQIALDKLRLTSEEKLALETLSLDRERAMSDADIQARLINVMKKLGKGEQALKQSEIDATTRVQLEAILKQYQIEKGKQKVDLISTLLNPLGGLFGLFK